VHPPTHSPAGTSSPATAPANIAALVAAEVPAIVAIRRDLHQNPELSFQETRTSALVQRELAALNIAFKANVAGTGVVAYLPATDPAGAHRPSVALRADMDALPITECTNKPYASRTPGVMHACGHDGHTATLLGAARVLAKIPRPRPVTLIFQPAEENGGGGEKMVQAGALKGGTPTDGSGGLGNPVGVIFGQHGWPQLPLGTVATRPGPLLASVDDFKVTMVGTQAHGAYPHLGNDAILASSQAIVALQSIVARNVSPLESAVLTVGAIHSGTADNIIPRESTFIGTVRTLTPHLRALMRARFHAVVENVAVAMGCTAKIDWLESYPVTVNDPVATDVFFGVARRMLGTPRVDLVETPSMGGEDFSYFARQVPACFFMTGLRPNGAATYPSLHQPEFDFNDDALPLGIELFCRLAVEA
jgi:amidohydrolase